jgi:hypothetical protein
MEDAVRLAYDVGEDGVPASRSVGRILFHNHNRMACRIISCAALVGLPIDFSGHELKAVFVKPDATSGPHEYRHTCPSAVPCEGNPKIIVGS